MTINTDMDCTHMLMDVCMMENGRMAGNMERVSMLRRLVSLEWVYGMLEKEKNGLIKYKRSLQNEIKSISLEWL